LERATVTGGGKEELQRVAALWDDSTRNKERQPLQGWLDSPLVREICVLPKITDRTGITWVEAMSERLGVEPGGTWLSLGCGVAATEIAAGTRGLFDSLDALDASTVSLAAARKAATAAGVSRITFGEVDLNDVRLPESHYDVVMMEMSLHHVRELEKLLSEISRALKPNGHFFVNEFIGPRQFQFTDLQLGIVRDFLAVLPARLRQDSWTGGLKSEYVRMPIEHWNSVDPSESIRSDEIVPVVESIFDVILRADYGGTVLMLLLEHIIHNFDRGDQKDIEVLRLLSRGEEALIRQNVIRSDFTMIAARKRSSLAPHQEAAPAQRGGATMLLRGPDAMAEVLAQREALAASVRAIEASRRGRLARWLWGLVGRGRK
jgi:SAM-dependent methyltransferase